MYTVYILRTSKNTLYTGQTDNLEKRLQEHREKTAKSAKYLRPFTSFKLVYTETFSSRSEALKREWEIKQLSKQQKENLIENFSFYPLLTYISSWLHLIMF